MQSRTSALLEAVAVTAELCGRTFSEAAARQFVSDLGAHPEAQIIAALARCRREVRGVLTVSDVINRIDDGRPGPDEAWAMIPHDENGSVVWTAEMASAFGVALPMLEAGEKAAAWAAFRERYSRLVSDARNAGKPVQWTPSLGHDPRSREPALLDAVEKGRLSIEHARSLAPALPAPRGDVLALADSAMRRITATGEGSRNE